MLAVLVAGQEVEYTQHETDKLNCLLINRLPPSEMPPLTRLLLKCIDRS